MVDYDKQEKILNVNLNGSFDEVQEKVLRAKASIVLTIIVHTSDSGLNKKKLEW